MNCTPKVGLKTFEVQFKLGFTAQPLSYWSLVKSSITSP